VIHIGGVPIKVTSLPGLNVKGIDDIEQESDPNYVEPGFFKKASPERGKITVGDTINFNGIPIKITGKQTKVKEERYSQDPANPDFLSRTGVPQGAPTSPFLSIITLKKFLSQQRSVSYADDPVFFGDEEFSIRDFPEEGIKIHPEKSG